MRRLSSFLRLARSDRRLLLSAATALAGIRLGLWLLPFESVRRSAAHLGRTRPHAAESSGAAASRSVVWAVNVASRYVPASENCLNRALAAQLLLARRGLPARLRFGVRRDDTGRLRAHAWVEGSEGVLIGNLHDLTQYAPLLPLERSHQ